MSARFACRAHVTSECANICALRHRETHIPPNAIGARIALQIKQFSRIDLNIARLKRNHIAFSRRVARLHAAFFDCGICRGHLLLLAHKPAQYHLRELGIAHLRGNVERANHFAELVVGIGGSAERNAHVIRFVVPNHIGIKPGRRPNAHHKRTRRQRIERTRVAHAAFAENAAAGIHHVVRAFALRLVDAHDEAHARISTLHSLPSPPTNSPSSKAGISAKASSMLPL